MDWGYGTMEGFGARYPLAFSYEKEEGFVEHESEKHGSWRLASTPRTCCALSYSFLQKGRYRA